MIKKKPIKLYLAIGAVLFMTNPVLAGCTRTGVCAPDCSVSHCSGYAEVINQGCKANGYGNGEPFYIIVDGAACTCGCSCVAEGTNLLYANYVEKKVEGMQLGDLITSPYTQFSSSPIEYRLRSKVEDMKVNKVVFSNEITLTVSEDHTFISSDERVIAANELKVGDEVLDAKGEIAKIVSVKDINYSGFLYNLIVNDKSSVASDHVIITNGIQSGDWQLQSAKSSIEKQINLRMKNIPLVD